MIKASRYESKFKGVRQDRDEFEIISDVTSVPKNQMFHLKGLEEDQKALLRADDENMGYQGNNLLLHPADKLSRIQGEERVLIQRNLEAKKRAVRIMFIAAVIGVLIFILAYKK